MLIFLELLYEEPPPPPNQARETLQLKFNVQLPLCSSVRMEMCFIESLRRGAVRPYDIGKLEFIPVLINISLVQKA